jgi:hypothetical protein
VDLVDEQQSPLPAHVAPLSRLGHGFAHLFDSGHHR